MGTYHQAQICLNGHTITSFVDQCPELREKFCSKCGAETVTNCSNCGAPIRGDYDVPGVIDFASTYLPPSYCHNCGEPYPWTRSALETAKEIIWEDESLFDDEKKKMVQSLPDIISETPGTSLAVFRLKKTVMRCMPTVKDALLDFAVKFACELAKNQLGV